MPYPNKYTDRTCALIRRGRSILLKREDGTYLDQWTCIQAGPDSVTWTYDRATAMAFHNLDWAFAIARLYGCKVVSVGSRHDG
jgi:hypothetical protein